MPSPQPTESKSPNNSLINKKSERHSISPGTPLEVHVFIYNTFPNDQAAVVLHNDSPQRKRSQSISTQANSPSRNPRTDSGTKPRNYYNLPGRRERVPLRNSRELRENSTPFDPDKSSVTRLDETNPLGL